MKVSFLTLGCKVNQHETGALAALFRQRGYTVCEAGEAADIYIVNSCTVTASGDKKSLQWLRRAKRDDPQAVTVLTGCYPQAFPRQAASAPADIVVGNTDRGALVDIVEAFLRDRQPVRDIRPHQMGEAFEQLPYARPSGHTRAFLKVEDGCNRFCAYCVIPIARGRVRSRDEEDILRELQTLAAGGCREFVLSGINLSCYGTDTGSDLARLVRRAAAVPGVARLRLGSLEPDLVSDAVWQQLAAVPQLCPQFHLSLQSGCNATLQRMRRHYTTDEYAALLQKLRGWFEAPTLTTDVIVGFPGETEADFCESLAFVQRCRFLKVHVFSYSPRPGTAAAGFDGQLPPPCKAERSRRLTAAAEAVRREVIGEYLSRPDEVLLEKPCDDGRFTGYTRRYLPVLTAAPGCRQGQIVPVRLTGFAEGRCSAEVISSSETATLQAGPAEG